MDEKKNPESFFSPQSIIFNVEKNPICPRGSHSKSLGMSFMLVVQKLALPLATSTNYQEPLNPSHDPPKELYHQSPTAFTG